MEDYILEDYELGYIRRPKKRITPKTLDLIKKANTSVYKIADDMVMSAVLLDQSRPVVPKDGSFKEIPEKTRVAMDILERTLWNMEALGEVNVYGDGLLLLIYPDSIRDTFTQSISFLKDGIVEMETCITRYEYLVDNADEAVGYLEGYLSMRLEQKIKEFERVLQEVQGALATL